MNNFIKENNKWIVRILVVLGLGLIIKLWAFGLDTVCGSSGWISICIIPEINYYWTNAGYIAIVFLLISLYGIYYIKSTKDINEKVKIAFLIFILGLIGKPVFLTISDDFRFYLTPVSLQYKDFNGKMIDMDKYLELTAKYCDNFKEGDSFKFKYNRETMCSGKFETDFDTVEEYIKVLEYAKNHNFRFLYQNTFRWIDENVGLENVIKKYEDDTFYGYVMSYEWNNKELLNLIKSKTVNKEILKLINLVNFNLLEGENKKFIDFYEKRKYWDNVNIQIDKQLKKIEEINQKVF